MKVLLTGGAGYIGSHVCNFLIDNGHEITTIDDLSTGNKKLIPKQAIHLNCDIANVEVISNYLKKNKFDVVMHLAAFTRVGESVKHPDKYFNNNFEKAKKFINICLENNLKKFIFSSTGSVYGNTEGFTKISEIDNTNPINPYSQSKLNLENFLMSEDIKKKADCIILRFFNVAGADLNKRTGLTSNPDNLIKAICEVASKKKDKLIIHGNNYNTKDGTTIRDFIHVLDIAEIHMIVARELILKGENEIYNCGYGKGISVQEVINEMNKLLKIKLPVEFGPRRKGDANFSVANTDKFTKRFNWQPKFNDLKAILESALNWEKKI